MTTFTPTHEELAAADTALVRLRERLSLENPGADEATRLLRQANRVVAVLRQGRLQWVQHQVRMLGRCHAPRDGFPPRWSSDAAFRLFMDLQALWRGCIARLLCERHGPAFADTKADLDPQGIFGNPSGCQRLFPGR